MIATGVVFAAGLVLLLALKAAFDPKIEYPHANVRLSATVYRRPNRAPQRPAVAFLSAVLAVASAMIVIFASNNVTSSLVLITPASAVARVGGLALMPTEGGGVGGMGPIGLLIAVGVVTAIAAGIAMGPDAKCVFPLLLPEVIVFPPKQGDLQLSFWVLHR